MNADGYKRKLAAILSADVQGYSRLMGDNEAETVSTLTAYREAITNLIQDYNGRVVDSPGDNLLAEFGSVVQAVECAVNIQKNLKAWNAELPDNRKMEFRIGINLGDVIEEGERIYGDGVNIAARVEGLAEGGGICISGTVYDQIENKLDLCFEDLGEHSVKNITKPIRVYKIPFERKIIKEKNEKESASLDDQSLPDRPSIAVLPFTNMSGDPQQEYFSDGITEEIITALSNVPEMLVIARSSAFTYKDKPVKVQQVGHDLGVGYVLEGSVRKAENRVRITAQLIDATTGNHLWADKYDRDIQDVFAIQDEITFKVLVEMQVKLTDGIRARRIAINVNKPEAYYKFLVLRDHLNKWTKKDNVIAQQLAEEIIVIDPNWLYGYLALGSATISAYALGLNPDIDQSLKKAMELTQKAISLGDYIPHTYNNLRRIHLYRGRYELSLKEAKKAIELDPNFLNSYIWLAETLILMGKPSEAIDNINICIRLWPRSSWYADYRLGAAYCDLGRFDDSIQACSRALQLNHDNLNIRAYLVAAYILANHNDLANKEAEEILRIDPKYTSENFKKMNPYKNLSTLEKFVDSLSKAGLK